MDFFIIVLSADFPFKMMAPFSPPLMMWSYESRRRSPFVFVWMARDTFFLQYRLDHITENHRMVHINFGFLYIFMLSKWKIMLSMGKASSRCPVMVNIIAVVTQSTFCRRWCWKVKYRPTTMIVRPMPRYIWLCTNVSSYSPDRWSTNPVMLAKDTQQRQFLTAKASKFWSLVGIDIPSTSLKS